MLSGIMETILPWLLISSLYSLCTTSKDTIYADDSQCMQTKDCKYGNNGKGLSYSCNGATLKKWPDAIPYDTECLFLRDNQLHSFSDQLFSLSSLKVLDLGNNNITSIDGSALSTNIDLKECYLDGNNINLSQMPSDIFSHNSQLEVLALHGNRWNERSYEAQFLSNLLALYNLSVDGIPAGVPFSKDFGKLGNLTELAIYGDFDYISNDTFANFSESQIHSLSLVGTQLYDIEPLGFKHLCNLRTLVLHGNPNLGFVNMSHGWYGLRFTKIETLSVQESVPYDTNIITLTSDFYSYLNETHITSLHLDKNDIVMIEESCFHICFPYLEILTLDYNRITLIEAFLIDLAGIQNLRYLSVAHQSRRFTLVDTKANHSKSPESQAPTGCTCLPVNKSHELYNQKIRRVHVHDKLGAIPLYLIFSDTLETLILADSLSENINQVDELEIFAKGLQILDYSDNGINELIGPITLPNHAKGVEFSLRLSGNGVKYISENILDQQNNTLEIDHIDLSDNKLGAQLQNDSTVFNLAIQSVKILNLSSNGIKTLRTGVFENLTSLVVLNISRNSLRSANFNISLLHNLRTVDLSYNLLSVLPTNIRNQLDNLNNVSISLAGNPLDCSCSSVSFLGWMKYTSVNIMGRDSYECSKGDEVTTIGKVLIDDYHTMHIWTCKWKVIVPSIAGVLSAGMIVVGVIYIVRKFYWEIKFWLKYKMKKKGNQQHPNRMQFKYDAFVSYNNEDLPWIENTLIPVLEGQKRIGGAASEGRAVSYLSNEELEGQIPKFKLYVESFDSPSCTACKSSEHVSNIDLYLKASFKFIYILSQNSVSDRDCEYKLHAALNHSFTQIGKFIIIVKKDYEPTTEMSQMLRTVIEKSKCIEWYENSAEEARFWDHIKEALRSQGNSPFRMCKCGGYMNGPSASETDPLIPQQ